MRRDPRLASPPLLVCPGLQNISFSIDSKDGKVNWLSDIEILGADDRQLARQAGASLVQICRSAQDRKSAVPCTRAARI